MAKDVQKLIQVRPAYQVNRGAVKCESGLSAKYIATAIYDTALNDSAGVSNKTVAAHGLGVFLPTKAIITRAWWDVVTTFTSAADSATIAFSAQSAGDINAAIAISDASNVWDAGVHGGLPGAYALDGNALSQIAMSAALAATFVKLTAERELVATVAVQALTAGKAVLFVEYYLSA